MSDETGLTKDTFLRMAALRGIDTSDPEHAEELYASVKDILGTVDELWKLDLDDVEPANTFSPAAE